LLLLAASDGEKPFTTTGKYLGGVFRENIDENGNDGDVARGDDFIGGELPLLATILFF
jgi:hypothetical protein